MNASVIETSINQYVVRTVTSVGLHWSSITTRKDGVELLYKEDHTMEESIFSSHASVLERVASGALPPIVESALPELDFFEGVLGDDREYKAIVACTQLAMNKFDSWIVVTIMNALLCPPLAGQPRVTWSQIAEILKVLKGVRS